jgi:hypothetical protein
MEMKKSGKGNGPGGGRGKVPSSTNGGDYNIGYGKPPAKSRFKNGVSGNPKGRPNGSRNVGAAFHKAITEPVVLHSGEKSRKISSPEAMLLAIKHSGLKGNLRAAMHYLNVAKEFGYLDRPKTPTADLTKLTDKELETLIKLSNKAHGLD